MPPHRSIAVVATAALSLVSAAASPAHAETFLWRVQGEDHALFLGGTLHVLGEDDYPLPKAFDTAYEEADALVLETDLAALAAPEGQQAMLDALTYDAGTTIFDALGDATDERLEAHLVERGLPVEAFAAFRPGLLLSALTIVELQRLGVAAEGVDAHYQGRAIADGKALVELEPVEAQIDMLAALGEDDAEELVRWTLDDMDRMGELMASMTEAWRAGEPGEIERIVVAPMAERMPQDHDALLTDRNRDWLPRIEAMLGTEEIELVLVGAAHLVGEEGLLAALETAGYELEQL